MVTISESIKDTKKMMKDHKYAQVEEFLAKLMGAYPHSPVPHNLYGILLEERHKHLEAMKHFRAAYALDPAYLPSRYNLEQYGNFDSLNMEPAYCEADCSR